jgi:hypothetical protein
MTQGKCDVRIIHDDQGMVLGYVWRWPGRSNWGAILEGYCSNCAPEKRLGGFPTLAAAAGAVVAGVKAGSQQ